MFLLLLILIYISFIALGLPDALFGASWPIIHQQFNLPLSYAGIVTITISLGTIISSLLSDKVCKKFGSGLVTTISITMTALALLGFSFSTNLFMLILFAIPLGLGAGSVDAALNNYVALYFKAKHMSWLHCFWGIGASISPYIMGYYLSNSTDWEKGYLTVAIIQIFISILLFISLPLWKKNINKGNENIQYNENVTYKETFKQKSLLLLLLSFLCYCAMECSLFNWTSSYLNIGRNFSVEKAALYASMFYLGMTTSRLLSGFITEKLKDKLMIRLGYLISICGLLLILLPTNIKFIPIIGLFICGIGCGPIYPSMIHSTPILYNKKYSQIIIGLQMAFAYTGSTLVPPLFGLIATYINIKLFPIFLLIFTITGYILFEILFKKKRQES